MCLNETQLGTGFRDCETICEGKTVLKPTSTV